MLLDLVAEFPHYHDHLRPIWEALPVEVRGTDWGVSADRHRIKPKRLILAAGYNDMIRYPNIPVIYVEHGAGQSYVGMPLAATVYYSGSQQHRNVVQFLCPNEEVADRWSVHYPGHSAVVGCPKLDPWHSGLRGGPEERTVAVTFHWEPPASVWITVPELHSAFEIYYRALPSIIDAWRRDGWHVIGTAHPRNTAAIPFWAEEKVEIVLSDAEVLDRATILVADNTSMQAEFMSLGRPVVFLNHPSYRRAVDHGGRFWTWPQSLPQSHSVDTPSDLARLNLDDLSRPTWHPFAYADGLAAQRAAAAVLSLL